MTYQKYASEVYYITKKAGEVIMEFYNASNDGLNVKMKEDESPVTAADLAANKYIVEHLQEITPDIPIISEENDFNENEKIAKEDIFWLVDPLDGTKSYIKKTGEFTVNIALIEKKRVTGGAVFVPAQRVGYFTAEDGLAYKQNGDNLPDQIKVRAKPESGVTIVASKSHRTSETDEFIKSIKDVREIISASSSIKLCLIAEGRADIYPRFGRTMEWDIAAGQAVLEAAGGVVQNIDGSEFIYAKRGLDNPNFIAKSAENILD